MLIDLDRAQPLRRQRRFASFLPLALVALRAADIEPARTPGTPPSGYRPLVTADRLPTPLLAPASKEGEARLKQFKVFPGLKVQLWAAEPLLANPVAFSVDERGRIFTSETYRYRTSVLDIRHYMFMLEDDLASRQTEDRLATIRQWFGPDGERQLGLETEVVRRLEDTDQDGQADKSSVFADGFTSPLSGIASGILARNGEVWLTEIPSLWRFSSEAPTSPLPAPADPALRSRPKVHDDNFHAAELLRGWGVRFSFTGHDLHGLKFGPDGRLYFSVGDRGTHVVTREGRTIALPDEGAVFRCEPDGTHLEVVARGLRNPQELAFNEVGDLFTGDNDSDQGDRERWVQVVEGMDAGWRVGHQHAPLGNAGMWNLERLWVPSFPGQAAYLVPPIANIGDGPSGLVFDSGTSLPGALRNRFLLAYFKGTSAQSGIYSLGIRPAGASYALTAHDEFIWNSLVPDVDLGPDGAIYFADWHEGWPKSNKGRIYRATFPEVLIDPVVAQTKALLGEGMSKRAEAELLELLAHRDMRVRQEAQFELAGRGTISFGGLLETSWEQANPLARLHAIWGIGQVARRQPTNTFADELFGLVGLLKDTQPFVRAAAATVLAENRLLNASAPLAALLADPEPRVQLAAALGLARLASASSYRVALNPGQRLVSRLGRKAVQLAGEYLTTTTDFGQREILALLRQNADRDPVLRHAAVWALQAVARKGALVAVETAAQPAQPDSVRLGALLARRGLESPAIAESLTDPHPLLVLEAARAINDVPILGALPALADLARPEKLTGLLAKFSSLKPESHPPQRAIAALRDVRADQPLPWSNAPVDQLTPLLLRVVNANFRIGTPDSARRLAALAAQPDLPTLIRTEALHALGSWAKPAPRDRIVGVYRPLGERDPAPAVAALVPFAKELLFYPTTSAPGTPGSGIAAESLLIAVTEAVARLRLPVTASLRSLVKNSHAPELARAAALRSFARIADSTGDLESVLAFAARDPAEAVRLEASKLNAVLNPRDAAGQLSGRLMSGTQAEQQAAYTALGDLKSDAADAILAEALDKLMRREVAPEVTLDLVEAAAKRTATAVSQRLAAYQEWKLPKDTLSPYREALVGGDAARGRKIFYENPAVACTRCHQIGNDGGGNAGPKLDGLATRAVREHLLESIVLPNQQITPGFEAALITRKNGETLAGTVKSETATEVVLLNPEDGSDIRILKSDIVTREKGPSGMPEGFATLLSRQELRDVVEFLGTLK